MAFLPCFTLFSKFSFNTFSNSRWLIVQFYIKNQCNLSRALELHSGQAHTTKVWFPQNLQCSWLNLEYNLSQLPHIVKNDTLNVGIVSVMDFSPKIHWSPETCIIIVHPFLFCFLPSFLQNNWIHEICVWPIIRSESATEAYRLFWIEGTGKSTDPYSALYYLPKSSLLEGFHCRKSVVRATSCTRGKWLLHWRRRAGAGYTMNLANVIRNWVTWLWRWRASYSTVWTPRSAGNVTPDQKLKNQENQWWKFYTEGLRTGGGDRQSPTPSGWAVRIFPFSAFFSY